MERAKAIMVQGTASSCGKSLIAAALCRIFRQKGLRVAPFKAQNMSNNSYVTLNGLEMGRAQAVQAFAAGLEPDVRMNPVLLKPSSDNCCQVVLKGKSSFILDASQWHESRERLRCIIYECYNSLSSEYDLIVIEGAGSPAEINLKKDDIVNMGMAKMADAPVLVVGDIDRGGVFASLSGTMQLLDPDERLRVKGFIINKFRGNYDLLKPGLVEIEKMTGVPVLGVIPWIKHSIDEEDAATERITANNRSSEEIDICIIRLPHISNFTDFQPLESIPGVKMRWCSRCEEIGSPDLLILPGTKATISDLQAIKKAGIADKIIAHAKQGGFVLGICGGFQMLGKEIRDHDNAESQYRYAEGLGLIDMTTVFHHEKITRQISVTFHRGADMFENLDGITARGYEIHMGQSFFGFCRTFLTAADIEGSERVVGVAAPSGRIAGTYCHGLFDSSRVTSSLVNNLRMKKGLSHVNTECEDRKTALDREFDRLAEICRKSLDMERITAIALGNGERQ